MSGGTDQIVKVVSQADIDGAKEKITSSDTKSISDSLKNNLTAEGWHPIIASFAGGEPQVTTSAHADDQSDSVTVTQTTNYTMIGVKRSDLKTIIASDVKEQIKTEKEQNLRSDGAAGARFTVISAQNPKNVQFAMVATATVGPNLTEADVQKLAAGKKTGEVKSALDRIEGVTKVSVNYSPFWVSKVPKNQSKITVIFEKSGK